MKAALGALRPQLEEDGAVSPKRSLYRLHRRAKVLIGMAALLTAAIVAALGLFRWLDGNNGSSDFKAAFVAVEPPAGARPGSRVALPDAGQTAGGGLMAVSAPVETEDKETEDKETSAPDTSVAKKSGGQGEISSEARGESSETQETPTEETEHGVDDLLVRGEAALARMEMDQAESLFKRAAEKDPTVPRAWFGRGKVAFEQGHSDKAIRMIQRALKLNPGKPKWRIFLGKVYMAAGYRERAIKEWQRVAKIYPHNREARRILEEAGADVE
jgi:tetratricopeptide (TPR) repeat protein